MREIESFDSDFIYLYKLLFPGIFRFVYRLIGDEDEALQISQHTFTKLYSYYKKNPSIKIQKSLVFRIAHNLSIDTLRKKQHEVKINKSELFISNTLGNPQDSYIKKQQISKVRDALQMLTPRDQKCVLLYQEGFSYSEIAGVLGIKRTSVGKILSRATEKLAHIIKSGET